MLKRLELRDPSSCLNKAKPDELVFVLRENDPLFSQTVRHWATMAEGVHEDAKIAEANACADVAERRRRDREAPDCAPPAVLPTPTPWPTARTPPAPMRDAAGYPASRHNET